MDNMRVRASSSKWAPLLLVSALNLAIPAIAAPPEATINNEQDGSKLSDTGAEINSYRDNKVAVKMPPYANTKSAKNEVSKVPQASLRQKLLALPTAVSGAVVGVTVGVPVRIARDVTHETMRMRAQVTDDVAGDDKPDLMMQIIGNYTGMAYGLVSGVIKGSIKGTERGLDAGVRKPFSKESVSLKDPD
jgi:hypothetical protein